jgi:hypothetical protein
MSSRNFAGLFLLATLALDGGAGSAFGSQSASRSQGEPATEVWQQSDEEET